MIRAKTNKGKIIYYDNIFLFNIAKQNFEPSLEIFPDTKPDVVIKDAVKVNHNVIEIIPECITNKKVEEKPVEKVVTLSKIDTSTISVRDFKKNLDIYSIEELKAFTTDRRSSIAEIAKQKLNN